MDDIDKEKIFYVFIGIGLSLVAYFIFRQCKESQAQPQPLPLQSLSCAPQTCSPPLQSLSCAPQTCSPPPQACSSTCPPSPAYSNEHLLQLIENQQMQITSLTNHLLKASPLKEEVLTPIPAVEPAPVESAKLMEESKLTLEKQKVLSKLNPLKDNIGKAVFGMH